MHQPMYIMQFYRQRPGDVPARDMPAVGESLKEATQALSEALLVRHQDERVPARKRPHTAHLVSEDGSVPVLIRCVPGPHIEIVKEPHA
jgi:hypothetical protein